MSPPGSSKEFDQPEPRGRHGDHRPGRDHARAGRPGARRTSRRPTRLSAPFTFAALLIVFGGLVAAFLPLGVGLFAVLGGFFILTLITGFTDVSVFSLNLVTGLGLGLAIDYSLFIVSRYREELGARRVVAGRRRANDADRGPHGRVQRGNGRDLAEHARDLPDAVPALVRVRRSRGRRARRDLVVHHPARGARRARRPRSRSSGCSSRARCPKTAGSGPGRRTA